MQPHPRAAPMMPRARLIGIDVCCGTKMTWIYVGALSTAMSSKTSTGIGCQGCGISWFEFYQQHKQNDFGDLRDEGGNGRTVRLVGIVPPSAPTIKPTVLIFSSLHMAQRMREKAQNRRLEFRPAASDSLVPINQILDGLQFNPDHLIQAIT